MKTDNAIAPACAMGIVTAARGVNSSEKEGVVLGMITNLAKLAISCYHCSMNTALVKENKKTISVSLLAWRTLRLLAARSDSTIAEVVERLALAEKKVADELATEQTKQPEPTKN